MKKPAFRDRIIRVTVLAEMYCEGNLKQKIKKWRVERCEL
jgi:hypothetical protein